MPTNYEKHFGTPERAAEFIASIPKNCDESGGECDGCQLCQANECCNAAGILNWMKEKTDEQNR